MRAIFSALASNDKEEKKFVLAILYDIAGSPLTVKLVKELSFGEGLGRLFSAFYSEPVCVSFVLTALYKDVVVRNVLGANVARDKIQEVLVI